MGQISNTANKCIDMSLRSVAQRDSIGSVHGLIFDKWIWLMASVGRPRGFGSDPPIGSGRVRGLPHLSDWLLKINS